VAYSAILLLLGFSSAAPFAFALSFAIVGVVVHVNTLLIAKGFAPFEATSGRLRDGYRTNCGRWTGQHSWAATSILGLLNVWPFSRFPQL
jgi:hypothetical protein